MAACTSSSFLGTALPTAQRPARTGRSGAVKTSANLGKKAQQTVERGYKSQVRQAKKLLPNNAKLLEQRPGISKKLSSARNTPREGGFGGGGPYLKPGNTPGVRGIPTNIDPLFFVGVLAVAFVAITYSLTTTSTTLN